MSSLHRWGERYGIYHAKLKLVLKAARSIGYNKTSQQMVSYMQLWTRKMMSTPSSIWFFHSVIHMLRLLYTIFYIIISIVANSNCQLKIINWCQTWSMFDLVLISYYSANWLLNYNSGKMLKPFNKWWHVFVFEIIGLLGLFTFNWFGSHLKNWKTCYK